METYPLGSIEAEKVADALIKQVVLRHGVPEIVHSDQGRNFDGQVFGQLCEQLGMEKTRTSPFQRHSPAAILSLSEGIGPLVICWQL